jgi:hypothetical protein
MPEGTEIVILLFLIVLLFVQLLRISKLKKSISTAIASIQDLSFKIDDAENFLSEQLGRVHYDFAKGLKCLIYREETPIAQVIEDYAAKEILAKFKLIKKRDKGPFPGNLSSRAKECGVSLERLLIALNDRELEQ